MSSLASGSRSVDLAYEVKLNLNMRLSHQIKQQELYGIIVRADARLW